MTKPSLIPYGRQDVTDADVSAVVEVLRSDWLTQGAKVPEFEQSVCSLVGANYAVAVNSATSALHVACLALGLSRGDSLWTSPISFVASSNCARYCGADVDFVDIDPKSWNIDPAKLEERLVAAEKKGRLPKVVVPVHLAGIPCDMRKIKELSSKYGFWILEDASHALGTRTDKFGVGDCSYSDVTVFSFHPVKTITTGEGGVATTNCQEIANRMALFRSHGITRDAAELQKPSEGSWYYEQIDLGYNYRMTDVAAALGISQISRLDSYISRRAELANLYVEKLTGLPILMGFQKCETSVTPSRHLFVVRIDFHALRKSRAAVVNHLRDQGIVTSVHYRPIYLNPYYRQLGFAEGYAPEAEAYYAQALSLPLFPKLENNDISRITSSLEEALRCV